MYTFYLSLEEGFTSCFSSVLCMVCTFEESKNIRELKRIKKRRKHEMRYTTYRRSRRTRVLWAWNRINFILTKFVPTQWIKLFFMLSAFETRRRCKLGLLEKKRENRSHFSFEEFLYGSYLQEEIKFFSLWILFYCLVEILKLFLAYFFYCELSLCEKRNQDLTCQNDTRAL